MRRSGLRMRMAVSYVLVTVAAVVLVEGVVLGILLPRILANSGRASQAAAVAQRSNYGAKALTVLADGIVAHSPRTITVEQLMTRLAASAQLEGLGLARHGGNVVGSDRRCLSATNVEALISVSGTVLASSSPGVCPPGERLGFATRTGLAAQGSRQASHGEILWSVSPVVYAALGKGGVGAATPSVSPSLAGTPASGSPSPAVTGSPSPAATESPFPVGKGPAGKGLSLGKRPVLLGEVLGGVYAAAPAPAGGVSLAQVRPLLLSGAVALALVIPVGMLFGLLSTRRVIYRIKRLAEVTGAVADGDFRPRVPVSGGDEIGRLEDAFNRMTGRLSAAVAAERARGRRRATGRTRPDRAGTA